MLISWYMEQSKGGVEYANILRVMAGLNDEIKALHERLNASTAENEQLRNIRDELLAAQGEAREDPPIVEPEDAVSYRARIADLQVSTTWLFINAVIEIFFNLLFKVNIDCEKYRMSHYLYLRYQFSYITYFYKLYCTYIHIVI